MIGGGISGGGVEITKTEVFLWKTFISFHFNFIYARIHLIFTE